MTNSDYLDPNLIKVEYLIAEDLTLTEKKELIRQFEAEFGREALGKFITRNLRIVRNND